MTAGVLPLLIDLRYYNGIIALVRPKKAMPGGVVVAQGTLDPLTLVRIQAGQPRYLQSKRSFPAINHVHLQGR